MERGLHRGLSHETLHFLQQTRGWAGLFVAHAEQAIAANYGRGRKIYEGLAQGINVQPSTSKSLMHNAWQCPDSTTPFSTPWIKRRRRRGW
jgi:hypothetical protein